MSIESARTRVRVLLLRALTALVLLEREVGDGLYALAPADGAAAHPDPWVRDLLAHIPDLDPRLAVWIYTFIREAIEDLLLADDLAHAFGRSALRPPLQIEAWATARGIRAPDPVLAVVQQADRAECIAAVLEEVIDTMDDLPATEALELWRIRGRPVRAG